MSQEVKSSVGLSLNRDEETVLLDIVGAAPAQGDLQTPSGKA